MMPWIYQGQNFEPAELKPEVNVGFVYLIENLVDGRKYIGKKLFFFRGFKKVTLKNGKKKRKRILIESDWKTYYGSSNDLSADVKLHGEDKFKRTILHLCESRSECSYLEAKEQIMQDAILNKNFYNCFISLKLNRKCLKRLLF